MSDTLTVQFFGICTHLNPAVLREHGIEGRRVLLVNASSKTRIDEHAKLAENGVVPHYAWLQIARRDLLEPPPADIPWMPLVDPAQTGEFFIWELHGVGMRVSNAIATNATSEASCIPQLALYTGGASAALPLLGPAAWAENPELTACWFDFPHSALRGHDWQGATVGVVTIGLSGPPSLGITAFQGRGQVTIPVAAGAQVSLLNMELQGSGVLNADFLLHFLATTDIPRSATFPSGSSSCPQLHTYNPAAIGLLSGPGCGNAIYP